MEQLRNDEKGPVIYREKLLKQYQDRELGRLFGTLESDRFSLFDVENTLIQIGQNNPKARPHISKFVSSQKSNLESMLMRNAKPETKENPETTRKLNLFENSTKDLQKSLSDIQNSLNSSTSFSTKAMDNVASLFTDNTVFNTYNSSFETIKSQAKNILGRVQEIDVKTLTPNQKQTYNKLVADLKHIISLKLEYTGIVQMAKNEVTQIPQNLNYTAHAVKGEAIGLYEGTKAIVTGSVELLKFMVKYPFCSEYRQEINKQSVKIYDFIEKEGLSGVGNKVYEAIGKEMDRISKLPPEKQAQAIGEIASNVISMLAVIKAGTTIASKLGKVGQAENLITSAEVVGNTARAEKIREIAGSLLDSKNGLKAFDIILTGVAESILLKGLSVSYKATLGFLENKHMPNVTKIEFLEQEINKAKNMKGETPEENQILQKYIDELEAKKMELNKSIDVERQVKGLEKLGLPESFTRDLLESGILTPLQNAEKFDLLKRFEFFNKKGIDINKMVDEAVRKITNLNKEEALLIFSYTDYYLFGKLNTFMRGDKELLKTLTPSNIEATQRIIGKLEQALEKMPNMKGKLVYRGDDWMGYNGNIGEEINLKAFSSVFDNSHDAFTSEKRNLLLIIEGKEGRVKDISLLSIGVNFGDKLKAISQTNNEGVILPNSVIKIVGKTSTDEPGFILNKIKYRQVK